MNDTESGHSRLDSIRLTEGADKCKAVFEETCKSDKAAASVLINDGRLTFPSLFILLPQIESFQLYRRLSPIRKTASSITAQILKPASAGRAGYLREKNGTEYAALKWILETGKLENSLNDDYEEVLDITVSVLINIYKDKNILPDVCDMIFERGSKGHHLHDLVWAYFRSSDPHALKLIAQHLASPRDAKLACSLLNIEENTGSEKQPGSYMRWLDENGPFLYFTDESFQLSSRPAFYRVDLERKYVQKDTPSHIQQPIVPADRNERRRLEAFRSLGNEEKRMLADYSQQAHSDLSRWKTWIALPVDEQIKAAKQCCEEI